MSINKSVMKCCICNNKNVGEYDVINHKKYHICCIEDLKRRVDKAIECIKDFEIQANHIKDDIYLDETLSNKLLEILGGKE